MSHTFRSGEIFVFGSNLRGAHGAGAARDALSLGAVMGEGIGRQGQTYAIPTKDWNIETLSIKAIRPHVEVFCDYARTHWKDTFFVTALGTGLAGYTHKDIAPLFRDVPGNCRMPPEWLEYL